jgi:hypothetical protein
LSPSGHRAYDFSPCLDNGNKLGKIMLYSHLETLMTVVVAAAGRFGEGWSSLSSQALSYTSTHRLGWKTLDTFVDLDILSYEYKSQTRVLSRKGDKTWADAK